MHALLASTWAKLDNPSVTCKQESGVSQRTSGLTINMIYYLNNFKVRGYLIFYAWEQLKAFTMMRVDFPLWYGFQLTTIYTSPISITKQQEGEKVSHFVMRKKHHLFIYINCVQIISPHDFRTLETQSNWFFQDKFQSRQ